MTVAWKHLRQSVLAEFEELGALVPGIDPGASFIIGEARGLRPRVDVIDLATYERELTLAAVAKRTRERREDREAAEKAAQRRVRGQMDAEAYEVKLRRDGENRRAKRLQRATTLGRACRHCKVPMALTPRTVHRKYCGDLCKHRYWAARKKT